MTVSPYTGQPQRGYGQAGAGAWTPVASDVEEGTTALEVVVLATQQRINDSRLLTPSQLDDPDAQAEEAVRGVAREIVEQHNQTAPSRGLPLFMGDLEIIVSQVVDEILGWGPLATYMRDDQVEEIIVNDFDRGFIIYAGGRKEAITRGFRTPEAAVSFFNRKIEAGHGYPVNPASPHQDAQLSDGSRLFVAVPPLTDGSLVAVIRRFRPVARSMASLIELGTITPALKAFLDAAMKSYLTTVIAGGTGTGKTTFLQALTSVFPPGDRVVTVEDTRELQLEHLADWSPLRVRHAAESVTEIGMGALVRDALRMRPTRIILGEARGGEMVDILTACNTGHDGTLFTIHANSVRETVERMVTMYRMGKDLAPEEVRKEILMAVRLVLHLKRTREGLRYVAGVGELQRIEGTNVVLEEIFTSPSPGQVAQFTGTYPKCRTVLEEHVPGFDFVRDVVNAPKDTGNGTPRGTENGTPRHVGGTTSPQYPVYTSAGHHPA